MKHCFLFLSTWHSISNLCSPLCKVLNLYCKQLRIYQRSKLGRFCMQVFRSLKCCNGQIWLIWFMCGLGQIWRLGFFSKNLFLDVQMSPALGERLRTVFQRANLKITKLGFSERCHFSILILKTATLCHLTDIKKYNSLIKLNKFYLYLNIRHISVSSIKLGGYY